MTALQGQFKFLFIFFTLVNTGTMVFDQFILIFYSLKRLVIVFPDYKKKLQTFFGLDPEDAKVSTVIIAPQVESNSL